MAYNFCAVQRKSDGKYLQTNGTWGTLDFTSNYTTCRFYYSDADDVANYITSYPSGDFRVIEFWIPGSPNANRPKSNATVLGNFQGSLYSANEVTVDSVDYRGVLDRCRVQTVENYNTFLTDWNTAGGRGGYLLVAIDDIDNYAFQGWVEPSRIEGIPAEYEGGYGAIPIASTNSNTTSGGYRRIVYSGAFSDVPFSGINMKFVFV